MFCDLRSKLFKNRVKQANRLSRYRRRLLAEALEDRRLLSASPTYMNDDWHMVTDIAPAGPSLGDTVSNANDVATPQFGAPGAVTATYGTTAFGAVTTPVGSAGSDPLYDDIQDAITGTDDDGMLNILAGSYSPASTIQIDKALTVRGPQAGVDPRLSAGTTRTPGGPGEAVIDGSGGSLATILRIAADDVLVNGLEFRNAYGDMIESLEAVSPDVPINNTILRYNIIHDTLGVNGDEGMQLRSATNALVEYNHVYNTVGDGINLSVGSNGGMIYRNEVHDVHSTSGAIYVYGSTGVTIRENLVYNSLENDGIKLGDGTGEDEALSGGLIEDNVVHDVFKGGDGITVYMSGVTVRGNEVYGTHSFHGAVFAQFFVDNVIIEDNIIHDNLGQLTDGEQVWTAGVKIGRSNDFVAFVTVRNNRIIDNDWGILVDGGTLGGSTALIEGNDLTGNDVGVRIQRGALVDMGAIYDAGDGNSNPTGRSTGSDTDGSSNGRNNLTGYTGVSGNYAIENLNLGASGDPDVKAENNFFGTVDLGAIEPVVYDQADDAALTLVDFNPPGSPPRIIDDGDLEFSTIGSWEYASGPVYADYYASDTHFRLGSPGSNLARWTFTGLTAGEYRVSATWVSHPNRATNAQYTVGDGSTVWATVQVNQQPPPDDFTDAGASWEDLGESSYTVTGSTLVVELLGTGNGYLIADAVRIEAVPKSPVEIVDDGDPGFSTTGTWQYAAGPSFSEYFESDTHFRFGSPGDNVASWTFSGLSPGQYRISATWVAHLNRATDAQYQVGDGSTVWSTVTVNQEIAPGDLSDDGALWEDLGAASYAVTGGTVVVSLLGTGNEYLIADAVRVERLGDVVHMGPEIDVRVGTVQVADDVGTVDFGRTPPGVPVSKTFTVYNVGTEALTLGEPISVPAGFAVTSSFGATTLGPDEFTTFEITMSSASEATLSGPVSFLTNDADEDPFNFSVTGIVAVPVVEIIDDGDAGFSTTGSWQYATGAPFSECYESDTHFRVGSTGDNVARWTFNGLAPGQYRVSATWVAHPNRATNAQYQVGDGSAVWSTITVNQELGPNDLDDAGASWEDLGTSSYVVTGTAIVVELLGTGNEYLIADAIRVERVGD